MVERSRHHLETDLTPPARILLALQQLQAHRTHRLGAAAGAAAAAGLALGLGVALSLAQHGWLTAAVALAWASLGLSCGTAAAASAYRYVWPKWRHRRAVRRGAALAATLLPAQSSSLASAIALTPTLAAALGTPAATAPGAPTHSAGLVALHLERTAAALQAADLVQAWEGSYRRRLHVLGRLPWVTGVFFFICALCFATGRSRLISALIDPNGLRVADAPLTADLQVHYSYPAYTQLPPRDVTAGDGSIEAVAGTEVTLQARALSNVRAAWIYRQSGDQPEEVLAAQSISGEQMTFVFPLLHDATYRLVVAQGLGRERLADPQRHTLHAVADAAPASKLILPAADLQLRDNQEVAVQWRAEDDFGLIAVDLVVNRPGTEAQRIVLWRPETGAPVEHTASGQYTWAVANLGLKAGESVAFHIAATDADTHTGPKAGVSVTRHLTLFSARAHHEETLAKLRATLDSLVDALGFEIETSMPAASPWEPARNALSAAQKRTDATAMAVQEALDSLASDRLATAELGAAFANVRSHVHAVQHERQQQAALTDASAPDTRAAQMRTAAALQSRYVAHLEGDVIYLDDLLAVSRINELKTLAKDLLANQRDLKGLLSQYADSHDPALKAHLEQGITALREQMLDVLRKMADIKKNLPGEYRNMEASTMLRLDDQLQRLDKQLQQNDLAAAANELEQLANMVENMAQSLGRAEKAFGGDRYDGIRQQLQDFAQELNALEDAQTAVSEGSDALLDNYRRKAMAQSAKNMDDFIKKARRLAQDGLHQLDQVGRDAAVANHLDHELAQARQGLLDIDTLLAHADLAEAHRLAPEAQDDVEALVRRMGPALTQDAARSDSRRASSAAAQKATALETMLAQLFPDPSAVLAPQQQQRMADLGKKEADLAAKAQRLAERMAQMAETMPLFGDAPQQALRSAQQQMGAAAGGLSGQALAEGTGHSRRATEQLGDLRRTLQQAAQAGDGQGLPLPLNGGPSGHAGGRPDARPPEEEVAIPAADRAQAGPAFRRELMEAAKQKAPAYYEDAVRRYYNELIR
jgi:hypothetical protein